jgi:uncharacterized protein YjbI with pentapeptide repeats
MGGCGDAPNEYCGFILEPEDIGVDRTSVPNWHEVARNACCIREPKYNGLCVWHADTDEKDPVELESARLTATEYENAGLEPASGFWEARHLKEHLSGAIIRNVRMDSLGSTILVGAKIESSNLDESTFSGTDLRLATFSEVNLGVSHFKDADLRNVTFSDTVMRRGVFRDGSDLRQATFKAGTSLGEVRFKEGTNLEEATFLNANLIESKFFDTNLEKTEFYGTDLTLARFKNVNLQRAEFLEGTILQQVSFSEGVELQRAKFLDVSLIDAMFHQGMDLTRTTFLQPNLRHSRLSGVNLSGCDLSEADLCDADLSKANLSGAFLSGADLSHSDLSEADLSQADLSGAYALSAEIIGVNLSDADLRRCTLEDAVLRNISLIDADLRGAKLHDAELFDVRINEETEFGDWCAYEKEAYRYTSGAIRADLIEARSAAVSLALWALDWSPDERSTRRQTRNGLNSKRRAFQQWMYSLRTDEHASTDKRWNNAEETDRLLDDKHPSTAKRLHHYIESVYHSFRRWRFWQKTDHEALEHPRENLEKATKIYRVYQRLHRENSIIGEEIPSYFVRESEARRKKALVDHCWIDWLSHAGQRWGMLYGERPRRVVYASVAIVLLFAVLFPLLGGVSVEQAQPTHSIFYPTLPFSWSLPEPISVLLTSLYFSAVTFTTLGYGGMQPSSSATQLLAAVESLFGALLIALYVAVVSRRVIR